MLELMVYFANGYKATIFIFCLFTCPFTLDIDNTVIPSREGADFYQFPVALQDIV